MPRKASRDETNVDSPFRPRHPDSLLAKEATELDLPDDIAYGIGLFRRAVLFL